jgi:hypothetical protein
VILRDGRVVDNELYESPKLMRLRRMIAGRVIRWQDQPREQAESLLLWIDQAIADWSREERRRRKARKRR